jgi:hypothetical protein
MKKMPGPLARSLRLRAAGLTLTAATALASPIQQPAPAGPPIDRDDIGGTVVSDEGPQSGVWVVAETGDLASRFTRIVVTDDQGRFVVPDLPRARYELFVRGYGLLDSTRVPAKPGERITLKAESAISEREAAVVYPAAYWLTVMRVPPTGPIHPADLTRTMKGCMGCHQLGTPATRDLSAAVRGSASHLAAWDERMKRGPDAATMFAPFARLRGQRTMFSEWTERVAAGIYPLVEPARPHGLERNLVVTLWDWGGATTVVSSAAVDPSNPNGRIFGSSPSHDALLWLDPTTHAGGEVPVPSSLPAAEGMTSPHFPDRLWRRAADSGEGSVDRQGRVWFSAKQRPPERQPSFCTDPTNPYARHFPLKSGARQLASFDPRSGRVTTVDTCVSAEASAVAADGKLYLGGPGVIGWIDAASPAAATGTEGIAAQGWCPLVVDTNRDRIVTAGWTEPDQPPDPAKDRRLDFTCRRIASGPDGAIWCAAGGVDDQRILRVEIGTNPPQSCRSEVFRAPQWRDVAGARDLAVDSSGIAWVAMSATDHVARFDRQQCKLDGSADAAGNECAEGWRFFPMPGPPFSIASPTAGADSVLRGALAARTTDFLHGVTIDRFDTLGLNGGRELPFAITGNSDAVLALLPATGEFVTLRVPYPLGFYGRSLAPRIDDAGRGWKGRGLWSSYSSQATWHAEGGPGVKGKVVKFQLRPDPLAK